MFFKKNLKILYFTLFILSILTWLLFITNWEDAKVKNIVVDNSIKFYWKELTNLESKENIWLLDLYEFDKILRKNFFNDNFINDKINFFRDVLINKKYSKIETSIASIEVKGFNTNLFLEDCEKIWKKYYWEDNKKEYINDNSSYLYQESCLYFIREILNINNKDKLWNFIIWESKLFFDRSLYTKGSFNYILKPLSQIYKDQWEILKYDVSGNNLQDLSKLSWKWVLKNNIFVDKIIIDDLLDLSKNYKILNKNDITISSWYRSIKKQTELFNMYKKTLWEDQKVSTYPWTSEHHLWTTIDFWLWEKWINYTWLENNSYKYWFVQSYNKNCLDETWITSEKWHFRWIWKTLAEDYKNELSKNNDLCFIDFLRDKTWQYPNGYFWSKKRQEIFNKKYWEKYKLNESFRNCIDNEKFMWMTDELWAIRNCKYHFWEIKIMFWWDIMLSRTVWYLNKKDWYDRIFEKIHPNKDLDKDTILFYNLESPLSLNDKDTNKRSFVFWANTNNIKVLDDLRTNKEWDKLKMVLSLTNNHITNAWWEWINTTIKNLNDYWIDYVWVSNNNWNSHTIKEIVDNNWNKVCFQSYTYDWGKKTLTNENNKKEIFNINSIDINNIKEDLNSMKSINCDLKIISLHWWNEYRFGYTTDQQNIAHEIIDNWWDLIIWSHSHVFWKVEDYKWKKIYYSLGNFIFDQNWWKDGCQKWMDCWYDKILKKHVVPTHISTNVFQRYIGWFESWSFELNKYYIDDYMLDNWKFIKEYNNFGNIIENWKIIDKK